MTQLRPIAIDLPEDLILAIGRAAQAAGLLPTEYVRDKLADLVGLSGPAPLSNGAKSLLGSLLDTADGWFDLQTRLRAAGFVLRPEGADSLVLFSWPIERRLMPLADLGHTLADLSARFRAPFPGLLPGTRLALTQENFPDAPLPEQVA